MKKIFVLLLLVSFTINAQNDDKADNILQGMSKEIKALNSFYLDFTVNIKNSATGENSHQKGSGYVKGDKFNATLGENTIISNGVKVWTVVEEEKVVYESDADDEDEESINPKKLMTIWESGFKSKYEKEDELEGEKIHVINLYPTNPGDVQYHTIILNIVANSNELKRAVMKTKDGTTMTYTVEKFSENVEVSDSKFVYDARKNPGFQLIRD